MSTKPEVYADHEWTRGIGFKSCMKCGLLVSWQEQSKTWTVRYLQSDRVDKLVRELPPCYLKPGQRHRTSRRDERKKRKRRKKLEQG